MSFPIAILATIALMAVYYFFGIGILIIAALILVPVYYAGKNITAQIRTIGNWSMRWNRFAEVVIIQTVLGIALALTMMDSVKDKYQDTVLLAFLLYSIFVAITIGIAKKSNQTKEVLNHPNYGEGGDDN